MDNNKKTALVTGSSRGIGAASAIALARKGFSAIALLAGKDNEGLLKVKGEIEKNFPKTKVHKYLGDVADEAFVDCLSNDLLEKEGKLDVLVNNAAISFNGLLQDMTFTEWKRIIDVNLSSLFLTSRAFIPSMLKNNGGRIINISSMWGRAGASCEVAYSASKGGVEAFTKALAKELARSNIAVNAIAPGVVDTVMNDNLSPKEKIELAEEIPLGRFATAEEVADLVSYLSSAPYYLTGQVIGIDGGFI